MRNYRHVLDVSEDASEEQIKAQYKVLVRIFHPDRYTDAAVKVYAEQRLKEINEAYRALLSGDEGEPSFPGVTVVKARPLPVGWRRLANRLARGATYRRAATYLGIVLFLLLCGSVVWLSISAALALTQINSAARPRLLLAERTPTLLPTPPQPTATVVMLEQTVIEQTANLTATAVGVAAAIAVPVTETAKATSAPQATETLQPTATHTPFATDTPLPTATATLPSSPTQVVAVAPATALPPTSPPATLPPPPQPPPTVTILSIAPLQPIHGGMIVTIANRLNANARADADTNSQALALLLYGTSVEAVGRTVDTTWLRVVLPDGRLGWVFATLVAAPTGKLDQLPILYTVPQQ